MSPDEDGNESEIDRSLMPVVTTVATQVSSGMLTPEQGQAILEGAGLSAELAKRVAGEGRPEGAPDPMTGLMPGQQPGQPGAKPPVAGQPAAKPKPKPKPTEAEAVAEAAKALGDAARYLTKSPDDVADELLGDL